MGKMFSILKIEMEDSMPKCHGEMELQHFDGITYSPINYS
jgi:hypothetical protein